MVLDIMHYRREKIDMLVQGWICGADSISAHYCPHYVLEICIATVDRMISADVPEMESRSP